VNIGLFPRTRRSSLPSELRSNAVNRFSLIGAKGRNEAAVVPYLGSGIIGCMDANSIIPPVVLSTATLASNATSAVKNFIDIAKQVTGPKSVEASAAAKEVDETLLVLRRRALDLDDENQELRAHLKRRESISRKGDFGYFFQDGDPDPLCPKCYEGPETAVRHLSRPESLSGGIRRRCFHCDFELWEQPKKPVAATFAVRGGRNSWMG
jgi:hypothetical protein